MTRQRSILITGGSRGIGFAIATQLASADTHLLLVARDEAQLHKAQNELSSRTARVSIISTDLGRGASSAKEVGRWAKKLCESLDILVLNAGSYTEGSLAEFTEESMRSNLEVNFLVNHFLVQELLPLVQKSTRRRILITGSTAAYEPYPLVPTYGVAKWALRGYALNLRKELMKENIGVTFISPGSTKTRMWDGEPVPEGRLLEASDIAIMAAAVCSLSPQAVVEELIVRPMLGDVHE